MKTIQANKRLLAAMVLVLLICLEVILTILGTISLFDGLMMGFLAFIGIFTLYMSYLKSLALTFFFTLSYGLQVMVTGTYNNVKVYIYLLAPITICVLSHLFKQAVKTSSHTMAASDEKVMTDKKGHRETCRGDRTLNGCHEDEIFYTALDEAIGMSKLKGSTLALMAIDLEAFELLNKRYGTSLDYVATFMELLKELTLATDQIYRFKDGSCYLILANTDGAGALLLKKKIINNLPVIELVVEEQTNQNDFKIKTDIIFSVYTDDTRDAREFKSLLMKNTG